MAPKKAKEQGAKEIDLGSREQGQKVRSREHGIKKGREHKRVLYRVTLVQESPTLIPRNCKNIAGSGET